jgi:hypothetical protein
MVLELDSKKYVCNICHESYDNRRDAEECEKGDEQKREIENIERLRKFTLSQRHLELLKRMYVDWDDCEYGAPCINPKRPYGNSDVENDIAEIIEYPKKGNWDKKEEMWNDKSKQELYIIHREMQIALQICLATGRFEIGDYIKEDDYDSLSWKKQTKKEGVSE